MRKLIASGVGGVVAIAPVTAAFAVGSAGEDAAAPQHNPFTTTSQALHPLEARALGSEAVRAATRAETRAERRRLRERRAERARSRRADRRAAATGGPAAARRAAGIGGGAPAASPALEAIAACESGGNPGAIGGGGAYRGKYQFSYSTWAAVGGSGDPAAAPEAEQDRRAALLYSRAGSSPWPVCGG